MLGILLLYGAGWHAASAASDFFAGPEGMPLEGVPVTSQTFPEPEALRPAVDFWSRVYTEVGTDEGFVHDSKHPSVVYETVSLQSAKYHNGRARKVIKARKRHWNRALRRLATGQAPRNGDEQHAVEQLGVALGRKPTSSDFRHAAHRLRFQLGQRDKFRLGLIRSGAYEEVMRRIFHRHGLPEDLAYLPHVESSFNTRAYSKYGAAGVWQFMRSTGRLYLTIDHVVDERLDPLAATDAAARLLKHNYAELGTWPLAITAYNHGTAGMKRAKRRLKTSDFATIVERYRGRTFGFASRNFYAQFLAARRVARDYESYFGPLERDTPDSVERVELPFYVEAQHLEQHLGVDAGTLRRYNPSLRASVYRADKRIPRGFTLQLPSGTTGDNAEDWLASIPPEHRYREQRVSRYYVVRRGDTLSSIAKIHKTKVETIVALNGLRDQHRIYPGQRLEVLNVPGASASAAKASPPPQPKEAVPANPEVEAEVALAATKDVAPVDALPSVSIATTQLDFAETVAVGSYASEALDLPEVGPVSFSATGEVTPAETKTDPVDYESGRPLLPDEAPWQRLEGDTTYVFSEETLGHFADWLEIPTQRLRTLNGLSGHHPIHIGQMLELDFSRVSPERFIERRVAYHRRIEDRFFAQNRITALREHELRRGESLWTLSREVYGVSSWLLYRCNPDAAVHALTPGTRIKIPVVEPLTQS